MESLIEHIRVFIHTIGRSGEIRFNQAGMPITLKQHYILTMLSKSEEVFQTLLAEVLRQDKSAVLREIDALEELGLVLRQNDAVDRRKKRIIMTEEGHVVFAKGQTIIATMLSDLTQGISEQEMAVFRHVLNRISENGESTCN